MKLKDIEKSIRKESDNVRVPDVYSTAKRAPINRLLTGETPIRAFEKKLATRLLAAVSVLLVVIAICMTVMWASRPAEQGTGQGYVSVRVDDGESEVRYSLVLSANGEVLYAAKESDNYTAMELVDVCGKKPENAVSQLYQAKSGDKVTICVYYANAENARTLSRYLGDILKESYDSTMQKTVSCYFNLASEKEHLVAFVNANIATAQLVAGDDFATIVEQYCIALCAVFVA